MGVHQVYILLYLMILVMIYIYSFKDSFNKENLNKVKLTVIIVGIVSLLFMVLMSIGDKK